LAVTEDAKKHDATPYENLETHWDYLSETSKKARALRLVDPADFDDHRNPDPHLAQWIEAEYSKPTILIPEASSASPRSSAT
jgi:hypothetical protein